MQTLETAGWRCHALLAFSSELPCRPTEGRCRPLPLKRSCFTKLRHSSQAWRRKASSSMLSSADSSERSAMKTRTVWTEMCHAGSGVVIACLSRDESPNSGAAGSRGVGHESSLDPRCDHPHRRTRCRRITAGPGARGTGHNAAAVGLLVFFASRWLKGGTVRRQYEGLGFIFWRVWVSNNVYCLYI